MHVLPSLISTHFTTATTNGEKKEAKPQVVRKSNRKSAAWHYFSQIFILLSLSTNFSQTVSFLVTTQAT
jgi:hypothetical protein